jgi:hypothetical protein
MDPLVRGEPVGDLFDVHVIDTAGDPMIHLSRSRRPEVVIFGQQLQLRPPAFLYAGPQIMLKGDGQNRIRVMRFAAREENREVTCSPHLKEIIRKIVELGGSYADVTNFLQEAKEKDYLDARVVVDALPARGREYRRDAGEEAAEEPSGETDRRVSSPLPGLFQSSPSASYREQDSEEELPFDVTPSDEEDANSAWWDQLGGWFAGD